MTGSSRANKLMLITGAGICLAAAAAMVAGIVFYHMEHRGEGLVLLLMAVIADAFIMGGYVFANLYAKRYLRIPDIIAYFIRAQPRRMMYVTTAVLLSPVIVALTRIALFR